MLEAEDQRILQEFASRVRDRFPDVRIWAFGSRARGQATKESDFDVCLVLKAEDWSMESQILRTAWEVGFDRERVFNVLVFSREEFEDGPVSVSGIVGNILREGVAA